MSDLKTINDSFDWKGKPVKFVYKDTDSFDDIPSEKVRQCYGVCFYIDKVVVVGYGDHWGLVGGTKEGNETNEETLRREIKEESNMEVLSFRPIGYQKVGDENKYFYQLRFVCKVKPYGEFIEDPAGFVKEIKLIDVKELNEYINWGKVGDRIIERAIELRDSL